MNYRVSFPVIGLLDIHILQMRGVMGGGQFPPAPQFRAGKEHRTPEVPQDA